MVFIPETTKPLGELVQVLLTGPHTLTPAEREMIATYVSSENDCHYCQTCHGSTAAQHLGGTDSDYELISEIKHNYEATPISAKIKALLAIAGKVQKGGKYVTAKDIERAREQGATDKEIWLIKSMCWGNMAVNWRPLRGFLARGAKTDVPCRFSIGIVERLIPRSPRIGKNTMTSRIFCARTGRN